MNKIFIAIAATALLAACDKQDHTIVNEPGNPNAPEVNTVGVVLPPAIAASEIYRCKDNDLVYIDWLNDNLSANFRAEKAGPPIKLVAPIAGEAMVAEGYSLTGDATAATITLERPGKGSQSCKA